MGIKMVTVLMISRPRVAAWLALVAILLTSAVACQRVPLLAPSGSTITLTTTTTALPFNGTTRIVAQIIEPAGTPPHSGTHVTFTTTLGVMQPAEAETDINGQAIATFNAGGASGTATITAISGGANVGSAGALKILIGTAAVGRVIVNANPPVVPAQGGSSTISASVLDVNGNPLAATPVSFSTSAGTLNTTLVTTDQAGNAQAVLTTFQAATVTASVGATAVTPTTPTTPTTPGDTPTTPTTPSTPSASGQAQGSVLVGVAGSPTLKIEVVPSGTAAAPGPPPSAGLPTAFKFTVTPASSNPSPIRDVVVDWGDGSPNQRLGAITGDQTVNHVYGSPGTYIVTGTATDSFGTSSPSSISVTVSPKPQPVVSLTVTTTNPTAGADVAFTGKVTTAGSGTVIQSMKIDFGDGTVTNLPPTTGDISLHHVYVTSGNYTAVLTATDSNNSTGNGFTTLFVQAATPLGVSLTYTRTDINPQNTLVTFTATVTGLGNAVVTQYLWDFGDNSPLIPSSTNTITHQYARPGTPTATLVPKVTVTTSDNRTTVGTTTITP
jgi:PKD repeat protein